MILNPVFQIRLWYVKSLDILCDKILVGEWLDGTDQFQVWSLAEYFLRFFFCKPYHRFASGDGRNKTRPAKVVVVTNSKQKVFSWTHIIVKYTPKNFGFDYTLY